MKKTLIAFALIFPLLSISLFLWKVNAEAPEPTPEERYETAMEAWLDKVVDLESEGDCKVVNPKDSDGLPAFGSFQFKLTTVISLSKKYDVYPTVTADTAYIIAMDCEKSRHLTKTVMQKNPKEFAQWGRRTRDGAGQPPVLENFL